jgi:hypothetical protein
LVIDVEAGELVVFVGAWGTAGAFGSEEVVTVVLPQPKRPATTPASAKVLSSLRIEGILAQGWQTKSVA